MKTVEIEIDGHQWLVMELRRRGLAWTLAALEEGLRRRKIIRKKIKEWHARTVALKFRHWRLP